MPWNEWEAAANDPAMVGNHQHVHDLSDVDEHSSDAESPSERRRSHSYGDAEDIMMHSYESFELPDNRDHPMYGLQHAQAPAVVNSPVRGGLPGDALLAMSSQGLHHRGGTSHLSQTHNAIYPQTPQTGSRNGTLSNHDNKYETPTPKRKATLYNTHAAYPQTTANSAVALLKRPQTWIKLCLGCGLISYALLFIQSSSPLLHGSPHSPDLPILPPPPAAWLGAESRIGGRGLAGNGPMFTGKTSVLGPGHSRDPADYALGLSSLDQWKEEWQAMQSQQSQIQSQRALERKQRTRPRRYLAEELAAAAPLASRKNQTMEDWYSIRHIGEEPNSASATTGIEALPVASLLDSPCGWVAQHADSSLSAHSRAALSSNSRVLITGILNPIGFHLAMRLHQECGVEVIGGVDWMYPNTVEHRVQLVQERMHLLHISIPKLIKPIVLPYQGLKAMTTDRNSEQKDLLASWEPTHVVHLASYSLDAFGVNMMDPSWKNTRSPYTNSSWFAMRSSILAMEELLHSLQNAEVPPHFLYASSTSKMRPNMDDPLFGNIKRMEEMLVQTYQIPSVALQLPTHVYGEWGLAGSVVHDAMEAVLSGTSSQTMDSSTMLEMMYVDDVVDAIVAAMQYQTTSPGAIDLTPFSTLVETGKLVHFLTSLKPKKERITLEAQAPPQSGIAIPNAALRPWYPRVPLSKGLIRTIAWHMERQAPFGPPVVERADDFLQQQGEATCEADDWQCHKSHPYLPCASECSTRDHCLPSIFDEIRPLTVAATEECDIVLYTQSLGYNVRELPLHSEYMDEAGDGEKLICNFAFVPRESRLVRDNISKVPNEQVAKFGITPQSGKDLHEQKLDGLNGRLLYRGWILIWVRDATEELSVEDRNLLKLSPSKLFHSDVGRAIFMEENFSVSPNLEDVSFLVSELNRKPFAKRTLKKDVRVETSFGKEVVKRQKFRLPAEPPRRAAILFSPLRIPNDPHNPTVMKYKKGDKKLKVYDAVKFMRHEFELESREDENTRRQREYYEKVASYINRNELRSSEEPWYRYNLRHWVRTRWVVHDTHLEEARLLRCDWYQEHVAWGTEVDQLSFAHVMAVRELKRRIAHREPDDHVKTFIEQHPQLKDLTDSYEWHPMETDANMLYHEPVQWKSELPDHVTVEEEAPPQDVDPKEPIPLYVRIMSERVMAASRKLWTKLQKKKKDKKK